MATRIARYGVALLVALCCPAARGFGPDLCFLPAGEIVNCTPLPPECPPGDDSEACLEAIVATSAQINEATATLGSKRSMVHMDYTFFAAQFAGFNRNNAFFIGAYDDATDLGRYLPRDAAGALLAEPADCDIGIDNGHCQWITKPLLGLNKVNILTGGLFYHFHAPYNQAGDVPVPGVDGMRPQTDAPLTEVFLSHLRRFAEPTEGVDLLCMHGLTDSATPGDYAYGNHCYGTQAGTSFRVNGMLNYREEEAGRPLYVPFSVPTGPQVLHMTGDGTLIDSTQFNSYIGASWRMARVGIFMHVYQDRLSHYHCGDASHLSGPYEEGSFKEVMKSAQCDQRLHVVRHAWETGADQSGLQPADRTLEAGLRGTLDELTKIATHSGIVRPRALDPERREAFIQDMLAALQIPAPQERMLALHAVATTRYKLKPMPGF